VKTPFPPIARIAAAAALAGAPAAQPPAAAADPPAAAAALAAEARLPLALEYTVAADDALGNDGIIPLRVTLTVEHPPEARTVVAIPVWTPGSYRLRPFPERIHDVTADDGGEQAFAVQRIDPQTWQVKHGAVPRLRLRYRVDLHENDRFMLRGTRRRCITYEGPAVYLYLRDHLRAPCFVRFDLPADWQVGSGLAALPDCRRFATDYDVLADCPVKLGQFQQWDFTAHGRRIEVVVDGPGDVEFASAAWIGNIEKVVAAAGDLFGGLPFDRYVFLFTASPGGEGGGLEHLYSTCIGVPVAQLRRSPMAAMSTIAHEFFHTFNVKRLRPVELGPFDYARANRTDALWLMEGVTSYYAQVLLARAGLLDAASFWRAAARRIAAFEASPARDHVSPAQASHSVWDDRPADRALDYYTAGEVLGLLLDLEIRGRTANTRSLDDVMRALYRLCLERGRGFERGEVAAVAGAVAGCDLREWFDLHVHGTVVPDYPRILGYAGLACAEEVSTRRQVRGVQPLGRGLGYANPDAATRGRIDARAGRIVGVDGTPVESAAEFDAIVDAKAEGDSVVLKLETLTGEVETRARVSTRVVRRMQVAVQEAPSPQAQVIRDGIAGG
jgi:predicted metalloprotease with PDZ domain